MTTHTKKLYMVGTPTFRFEPVTTTKLRFVADTTCIQCGRPLLVAFDEIAPVFRIGREFCGVACAACLSRESQAQLQKFRTAREEA